MTRTEFETGLKRYDEEIEVIRAKAHKTHEDVNQKYGKVLPYGHHLDMVVNEVIRYGHHVCKSEDDILTVIFGGFFHDSIEDARLTYNDVRKIAASTGCMNETQVLEAAEIVYALTNEKGRNREERAGDKYYRGIRNTAYAPFLKMCDRLANITFSCENDDELNRRMKTVYKNEMPHFIESLACRRKDIRYRLPEQMVQQAAEMLEK